MAIKKALQTSETPAAKPIVITNTTKAITPWASKDTTRYALQNICFEPDGRQVTSNGHGLAILTPVTPPTPDQFPMVHGIQAATTGEPRQRLLSVDSVNAVIKQIPKGKDIKRCPMLANAWELQNGQDTKGVHLGTTNLTSGQVSRIAYSDARYPDWEKVLPRDPKATVIGIDPEYLRQVGESMKAIGATRVKLVVSENTLGAMRFEGESVEGGQLTIIVMPMRL